MTQPRSRAYVPASLEDEIGGDQNGDIFSPDNADNSEQSGGPRKSPSSTNLQYFLTNNSLNGKSSKNMSESLLNDDELYHDTLFSHAKSNFEDLEMVDYSDDVFTPQGYGFDFEAGGSSDRSDSRNRGPNSIKSSSVSDLKPNPVPLPREVLLRLEDDARAEEVYGMKPAQRRIRASKHSDLVLSVQEELTSSFGVEFLSAPPPPVQKKKKKSKNQHTGQPGLILMPGYDASLHKADRRQSLSLAIPEDHSKTGITPIVPAVPAAADIRPVVLDNFDIMAITADHSVQARMSATLQQIKFLESVWPSVTRFAICLLIGLGVSVLAWVVEILISYGYGSVLGALKFYFEYGGRRNALNLATVVWSLLGIIPVFFLSALFASLAVTTTFLGGFYPIRGSGMPHLSAFLDGSIDPKLPLFTLKVLSAKSIAVMLSLSSGMKGGLQGPLITLGALVGKNVSKYSLMLLPHPIFIALVRVFCCCIVDRNQRLRRCNCGRRRRPRTTKFAGMTAYGTTSTATPTGITSDMQEAQSIDKEIAAKNNNNQPSYDDEVPVLDHTPHPQLDNMMVIKNHDMSELTDAEKVSFEYVPVDIRSRMVTYLRKNISRDMIFFDDLNTLFNGFSNDKDAEIAIGLTPGRNSYLGAVVNNTLTGGSTMQPCVGVTAVGAVNTVPTASTLTGNVVSIVSVPLEVDISHPDVVAVATAAAEAATASKRNSLTDEESNSTAEAAQAVLSSIASAPNLSSNNSDEMDSEHDGGLVSGSGSGSGSSSGAVPGTSLSEDSRSLSSNVPELPGVLLTYTFSETSMASDSDSSESDSDDQDVIEVDGEELTRSVSALQYSAMKRNAQFTSPRRGQTPIARAHALALAEDIEKDKPKKSKLKSVATKLKATVSFISTGKSKNTKTTPSNSIGNIASLSTNASVANASQSAPDDSDLDIIGSMMTDTSAHGSTNNLPTLSVSLSNNSGAGTIYARNNNNRGLTFAPLDGYEDTLPSDQNTIYITEPHNMNSNTVYNDNSNYGNGNSILAQDSTFFQHPEETTGTTQGQTTQNGYHALPASSPSSAMVASNSGPITSPTLYAAANANNVELDNRLTMTAAFQLLKSALSGPNDIHDFIACGAAAGFTAAFNSPLAGVAMIHGMIRQTSTSMLIFRLFFTVMIAVAASNIFDASQSILPDRGFIDLDIPRVPSNSSHELFAFLVLGILGGFLGAGITKINVEAQRFRAETMGHNFWKNIRYAIILAAGLIILPGIATLFTTCTRITDERFPVCVAHPSRCLTMGCPEGEFSQAATLFFNPPEKLLRLLWDRSEGGINDFDPFLKALNVFLYLLLACASYTAPVPGGFFMPAILLGAIYGRFFGLVISLIGGALNGGVWAVLGSTCLLAGLNRMSFPVAIMMVEFTSDAQFIVPIMIVIFTSKLVADNLIGGMEVEELKMKGTFLSLGELPHPALSKVSAQDIMSTKRAAPAIAELIPSVDLDPSMETDAIQMQTGANVNGGEKKDEKVKDATGYAAPAQLVSRLRNVFDTYPPNSPTSPMYPYQTFMQGNSTYSNFTSFGGPAYRWRNPLSFNAIVCVGEVESVARIKALLHYTTHSCFPIVSTLPVLTSAMVQRYVGEAVEDSTASRVSTALTAQDMTGCGVFLGVIERKDLRNLLEHSLDYDTVLREHKWHMRVKANQLRAHNFSFQHISQRMKNSKGMKSIKNIPKNLPKHLRDLPKNINLTVRRKAKLQEQMDQAVAAAGGSAAAGSLNDDSIGDAITANSSGPGQGDVAIEIPKASELEVVQQTHTDDSQTVLASPYLRFPTIVQAMRHHSSTRSRFILLIGIFYRAHMAWLIHHARLARRAAAQAAEAAYTLRLVEQKAAAAAEAAVLGKSLPDESNDAIIRQLRKEKRVTKLASRQRHLLKLPSVVSRLAIVLNIVSHYLTLPALSKPIVRALQDCSKPLVNPAGLVSSNSFSGPAGTASAHVMLRSPVPNDSYNADIKINIGQIRLGVPDDDNAEVEEIDDIATPRSPTAPIEPELSSDIIQYDEDGLPVRKPRQRKSRWHNPLAVFKDKVEKVTDFLEGRARRHERHTNSNSTGKDKIDDLDIRKRIQEEKDAILRLRSKELARTGVPANASFRPAEDSVVPVNSQSRQTFKSVNAATYNPSNPSDNANSLSSLFVPPEEIESANTTTRAEPEASQPTVQACQAAHQNTHDPLLIQPDEFNTWVNLMPFAEKGSFVISVNTPGQRVWRLFRLIGMRRLVVVDSQNRPIGIITRKDMMLGTAQLVKAVETKERAALEELSL